MSLINAVLGAAANGENLAVQLGTSKNYQYWKSIKDEKRCVECEENHGKIWLMKEKPEPEPPIHPWGRCKISALKTIAAGTATIDGVAGADWWIFCNKQLPNNYTSRTDAEQNGWKAGKWLSNFVSGKMIGGEIYKNKDGHLPDAYGRIWYEADINYRKGKRNKQRIVWSNDGLVFVTYDHYETFYEIV